MEYQEIELKYPFVLTDGDVYVFFASEHYKIRIRKSLNSVFISSSEDPEYLLKQGYKVSDIETFDEILISIKSNIESIEESIYEDLLKVRDIHEYNEYMQEKKEQEAIDNHENN